MRTANVDHYVDHFNYELVKLQTPQIQRNNEDEDDNTKEREIREQETLRDLQRSEERGRTNMQTNQVLRRCERIRLKNLTKGTPVYDEEPSSDSDDEDSYHEPNISVLQDMEVQSQSDDGMTPENFKEAMKSPHKEQLFQAMQEELNSLKSHGVWELVKRPKGAKTIPSKWIYRIKRNPDGSIDRFKARLVSVGCAQKSMGKPDHTFSPVVRMESLRTLLAVAKMKKFKMKIFDVSTAYLHGHLDDDVTMEQPEGFKEHCEQDLVCKLKRGLYGLRQSGKIWFQTLRNHLLSKGFKQLESDQCIFRYQSGKEVLFIAIYVDDFLALGSNNRIIEEGINKIKEKFALTDTTEKSTFLGWNINLSENDVCITQEAYAKEILKRFEMEHCKPVSTPLVLGQNLNDFQNSPKVDQKLYQEMVGSIMYLMTGSRPDLCFAMTTLSKYLSDPREIHMRAVKRTLRYIKGTINKGLTYKRTEGTLSGYTDASWNDGNGNEKSVSGYVVQVGENTVHWRSRRQHHVSLSTCQSEITAIAECMKDLIWTRLLLCEIDAMDCIVSPVTIYNDNQAAIACTQGTASNTKVRHAIRTVMFVRQQTELGNFQGKYVASEQLCADALTKTVSAQKLQKCMDFFNLK